MRGWHSLRSVTRDKTPRAAGFVTLAHDRITCYFRVRRAFLRGSFRLRR